jgi:hypothetical protein
MTHPANPQDRPSCGGAHIGTWKLQSFSDEDLETGQTIDLFGAHPGGYLSYGPDGRMSAILLKEGRQAPADLIPTDAERVALYSGFIAYAGTYSIDGDRISHHIDASWNEAWTGTTQVRQFEIRGDTLTIRTLPAKNPLTGRQSSAVLIWSRVG